jgi:2,3-bisphosphoglycerate-independent phosphoglycerate mutase
MQAGRHIDSVDDVPHNSDMPKKCILILLDGIGDRSYAELGGQTPLQAAHTPCLDRLAAMGASGLYHATRQGEALPSENAHFAIFGYEPEFFPGRGPLEALGADMDLRIDDVAVLAHFVTLRQEADALILHDDNPAVDPQEALQLSDLASGFRHGQIDIDFIRTHKAHGIVRLKGHCAPFFTDTHPFAERRPLVEPKPLAGYETDAQTVASVAALKNYMIHLYRTLQAHPLNRQRRQRGLGLVDGLVTQRAGRLKPVVPFSQRYGLKGLSMASGLVYHGLSKFLGLDAIKVRDTPDPGADLAERVTLARDALAEYDFIHVHTKAPDEAAHLKDPGRKKRVIEALDAALAQALPPLLEDPEVLLVITADHATPSAGPLIHSGETVPLLFLGQGVRRDSVQQFNEIAAAQGALGPVRGTELILMILNHLDRAKLKGLMDTPVDQPFWPGHYDPFKVN